MDFSSIMIVVTREQINSTHSYIENRESNYVMNEEKKKLDSSL